MIVFKYPTQYNIKKIIILIDNFKYTGHEAGQTDESGKFLIRNSLRFEVSIYWGNKKHEFGNLAKSANFSV